MLVERAQDAALYVSAAGAVRTAEFLRAAQGAAAGLPAGRYVLNLCRDRYRFAVGLAGALIAGRVSLLCGDPSPGTVRALRERYPDTGVIDDASAFADAGRADNPALAAEQLAAIVFTSGSTGAPVGHEKRWGELVARSRAAGERFGLAGTTIVGTVPPGHMYGLETTVLLPWHADCASWCGPAFYPADVAAALGAVGRGVLVTTPLQLRGLAGLAPPHPALCISATAPLEPALAAQIEAAWSAPVVEIFGATEVGSVASRRTTEGTAWRPYPGVSVGAGGLVRAPHMAPVALADETELLADGRFVLLGRRTDVVKLGGRRASIAGLNQILTGMAGVQDGVFVVPDDLESRSTARLVALVVAPERTVADLMAELRHLLDPLFLPRRLVQVDALPRNALGKLPREAVLDLLGGAG